MKKTVTTLLSACALLFLAAACTTDPAVVSDGSIQSSADIARKMVNSSQDAIAGSLIVYFNDEAVGQIERNATRAADAVVTRSGIADVDEALDQIGVSSFRRIFPYNAKCEAQTRAAGLHKWYVLTFPSNVDLDNAATKLAGMAEVSRVQFNTKLQKNFEQKVMPYTGQHAAATRAAASDYPFNDPNFDRQWDMLNTGDPSISNPVVAGADVDVIPAWTLTAGDPTIIVAIVDEGVMYSHPDLQANMWVNKDELLGKSGVDDDGNGYADDIYGYNFAAGSANVEWTASGNIGHGTHVAGTVAAVNNNGVGISGIAGGTGNNDGVKLMSTQIFSGNNGGDAYTSAGAIKYAADNGASIIQCSWGYGTGSMRSDTEYSSYEGVEKDAIDYFIANATNPAIAGGKGGLVIFAAGNDYMTMASYPGAYRDYIAVTSYGPDYLPACYTNYGAGCNIAAPGGDFYISDDYESSCVLSTLPPTAPDAYGAYYGYMQGTSQACPHVSGIAALGIAYALKEGKTFTLDEFKAMLLTSVNDIDTGMTGTKYNPYAYATMYMDNYRYKMGTGAIDAYRMLMQIDGLPLLKVAVGESQTLPLENYFGAEAAHLTYAGVEMSADDMAKLGISTAPVIINRQLTILCTKPGTATITVNAIAGGDKLGTGGTMGGMKITKKIAVLARQLNASNGGWL